MLLSIVMAAVIALQSRNILPERNFNDDRTIQRFINEENFSGEASSYGGTAFLFRLFGLTGSVEIIAVVAIVAMAICVTLALPSLRTGWSWPGVLAACGAMVLAGLYLGKYSKEFWILPITAIFLLSLRRRSWRLEIVWLILALGYATYVRRYWFLVLAIYAGWRLLTRFHTSKARLVFTALGVVTSLVLVFNVILGTSATIYRANANEGLVTDRATIITDFLPAGNPLFELINLAVVGVTLLVPAPLLFAGSPVHILSAIALTLMWGALLVVLFDQARARKIAATSPQQPAPDPGIDRALAWLFAFMFTQSLFEPDYGSYLRHLVPLMPVAVYVIARGRRFTHDFEYSTSPKRSVAASPRHLRS